MKKLQARRLLVVCCIMGRKFQSIKLIISRRPYWTFRATDGPPTCNLNAEQQQKVMHFIKTQSLLVASLPAGTPTLSDLLDPKPNL